MSSEMEISLVNKELIATQALYAETKAENKRLSEQNESLLSMMKALRNQLDDQYSAQYRITRLMRIFDVLDVPPPAMNVPDEQFMDDGFLHDLKMRVKPALGQTRLESHSQSLSDDVMKVTQQSADQGKGEVIPNCMPDEVKHLKKCLSLLLGASDIVLELNPVRIKISIENALKNRQMVFWLSWDSEKIMYKRISLQIEEAARPEFAREEGIEFDIHQGPNFLTEVLLAMYDLHADRTS